MPTDRTASRADHSEFKGRVLPFRRPGSLPRPTPQPPAVPDLGKYEQPPEKPEDFRHRMIVNGLGLAVTALLIAGGLWIADVMAHMRKDQDCVLIGRQNCMPPEAFQRR